MAGDGSATLGDEDDEGAGESEERFPVEEVEDVEEVVAPAAAAAAAAVDEDDEDDIVECVFKSRNCLASRGSFSFSLPVRVSSTLP